MMKQFSKLGYEDGHLAELSAIIINGGDGIILVAGQSGTKTEKMFRVVQDMGANAFLNDFGKAAKAEGVVWLFAVMSPPQALMMLERTGKMASALLSRRKIPLLCQSCAVPHDPGKRPDHDRKDAELLFKTFPNIDFSKARMPAPDRCQDCENAGFAVICEVAPFDVPKPKEELLAFGSRNPEKSMAAHAAALCARGLCDPAQAARSGGLLLWK